MALLRNERTARTNVKIKLTTNKSSCGALLYSLARMMLGPKRSMSKEHTVSLNTCDERSAGFLSWLSLGNALHKGTVGEELCMWYCVISPRAHDLSQKSGALLEKIKMTKWRCFFSFFVLVVGQVGSKVPPVVIVGKRCAGITDMGGINVLWYCHREYHNGGVVTK